MITKIDKETIDFVCKHKLTFTQFAICLLIYHKDTAGIIQIGEEIGIIGDALLRVKEFPDKYISELNDLIDRGYVINKSRIPTEIELDYLILTSKFTSDFGDPLTESEDMAKELWDAYPKHILIDNREVSAVSCIYEQFADRYLKAIKNSKKTHKQAMGAVYALGTYAEMGIEKWVGSRQWELKNEPKPKSHIS